MEVDPTTYFKNQVGEVVCFNLHEEREPLYIIFMISGMMILGLAGFITVMAIIAFLVWMDIRLVLESL